MPRSPPLKHTTGYRFVSGPSYLKSYSSVTCNVRVTHDECVAECIRFGSGPFKVQPLGYYQNNRATRESGSKRHLWC